MKWFDLGHIFPQGKLIFGMELSYAAGGFPALVDFRYREAFETLENGQDNTFYWLFEIPAINRITILFV